MSAAQYDWEQDIEDNRKPAPAISREQVEKLKADWLKDGCWDLETTEGFEEYHEELAAFVAEQKAAWERKQREYRDRVPERFRGRSFTNPDDIAEYLNMQAADGYLLVSLTAVQAMMRDDRLEPVTYALVEKKPL